ncbi:MAG: coproporphyrinogen III oxidase [Gomphosphaeria aponina SAG 52.96 = DSM 107014]|uniref:Heme chaperone HemW n=1 Tax=Gomphosphaeria aponina SAG 52.96 = DSM 107014 TaxID=1521640 RepID=A0A941GSG1_9CHRO|nr:coproporphyrinogen III oxidase [Gomphosphaeria aponina SAG 52.96 = DSM 107014]
MTQFPLAAYVHIPFCKRRCYYCDFPISVLGDGAKSKYAGSITEYVNVLCQEIKISPVGEKPLETVFFGGGTPSLLPVQELERILKTINQHFPIASTAEISMEIDPGTFTLEEFQGYKSIGVNRVSLGVQAFQEELLKICGRSHSLNDIFTAINLIHQVGISNFSLDLISGLPNQSLEQWQFSLESAIKIAPNHISCYDLVIEPVTAFGRKYQPGEKPLPTDELTAQMYKMAQNLLTAVGYQHYEISNYAQPGYQCGHNRVYWENKPYYGFGMGAASYVFSQRFTRPRTRGKYYAWVEAGCVIDAPKDTVNDKILDTLMLGLRLAEGLNLSHLTQQFGAETVQEIITCLQPYFSQGWVELINGHLRLSDPEGLLFSNTVLARLFATFGD